jgi:glycosyltransferase involved in cell wall biosynthesis
VELGPEGRIDPAAWAAKNGIRSEQFIDLGLVPNHLMARVLREMDAAVFPNRCEGGTNLVAMECLACGVPTIVADNTGQHDLVVTGAPYALRRQTPVMHADASTDGWGECDIDEIVEALEYAYINRDEAHRRGAAGARIMEAWSWRSQIGHLHAALTPSSSRAAA